MHIRKLLQRLRTVDHRVHGWTLMLVVVGAASQATVILLPKVAPGIKVGSAVTEFFTYTLHILHWVAVGALVLYAFVYYFFTRKPVAELAARFPKSSTSENAANLPERRGPVEVLYAYKGRGVSAEDVHLVARTDKKMAEIVHQMNHDAFLWSPHFELTLDEMRARNAELIARNQSTFLLLRDPNRESTASDDASVRSDFIGYTCVLPLNDVGTEVYLRGLVSDTQLPGIFLARDAEPAASLLLFAIFLERGYRVGTAGSRYVLFLARCVEHHIRELAKTHGPPSGSIDVWAQAEDESLRAHLVNRGFAETKKISKEGFPLYKRTLANVTPEQR